MTAAVGLPFLPAARLSEIRMRIEGIDARSSGALLVEGPDDKRLFLPFAQHPGLVVPCGGRTRLLQMYSQMSDDDHQRMLPVTDCDYEVARGTLRGGMDIVITQGTDVEADLLGLGLLERIIHHLIPRVLADVSEIRRIADELLKKAIILSKPLGRARMAAQPLGVSLEELEDFRFGRHRLSDGSADEEKILRTVHGRIREAVSLEQFRSLYEETPDEPFMCKGRDLIAACVYLLKADYRARLAVDNDTLDLIMRACISDAAAFGSWSVCKRIRQWEERTGRHILLP